MIAFLRLDFSLAAPDRGGEAGFIRLDFAHFGADGRGLRVKFVLRHCRLRLRLFARKTRTVRLVIAFNHSQAALLLDSRQDAALALIWPPEGASVGEKKRGQISCGSTPMKAAMARLARGCRLPSAQYIVARAKPFSRPICARFDPLRRTAAIMSARCQPSDDVATTPLRSERCNFSRTANQSCLKDAIKITFSSMDFSLFVFFFTGAQNAS
ncbi:hypothetical protein [Rhodoblastus sp.]|uniref:hypothetical protein n=1 Tax=Rhodoblastus sp. TaxID=1962975 RepID=UPI003F9659A6